MIIRTAFVALALATPALADPTDSAIALCAMIDSAQLSSEPCDVGIGEVIATFDMSSSEARELCRTLSGYAAEQGLEFTARWTLNIRSPYSDGNDIAFCSL